MNWSEPWLRLSDTYIYVSKLTIIVSDNMDNDLLPGQRQTIIWTNAEILLHVIGPLETNLSEILIKIQTFSLEKIHFKSCLENGGHFVSDSMS